MPITEVWKLRQLFEPLDHRSARNPELVNTFGKGTDHSKKPSNFQITRDSSNRVNIKSYLSSAADANPFRADLAVFSSFPSSLLVDSYDLAAALEKDTKNVLGTFETVIGKARGKEKKKIN